MHTAFMSGILIATWPCSVGTCQEPPSLAGGTVPGPLAPLSRCVRAIRREQRQGPPGRQPALWVPGRWKIPMASPDGTGGRLEGSFIFSTAAPSLLQPRWERARCLILLLGGPCRCDRRAPMTHPPPHLAVHLLQLLLAQVWPRRGASSPRTFRPQTLPWKGETKITPSKAGSSIHRTAASRRSVFGSHHGHGFNPVIPWHLLGPR